MFVTVTFVAVSGNPSGGTGMYDFDIVIKLLASSRDGSAGGLCESFRKTKPNGSG